MLHFWAKMGGVARTRGGVARTRGGVAQHKKMDPKMTQKWTKNGPKMDQKWTKKDQKYRSRPRLPGSDNRILGWLRHKRQKPSIFAALNFSPSEGGVHGGTRGGAAGFIGTHF